MHGTTPDLSPVLVAKNDDSPCLTHPISESLCAFILDHNHPSPIPRLRIPKRFPGPRLSVNPISPFSHNKKIFPPVLPRTTIQFPSLKTNEYSRRKLPKLVPHHIFRDRYIIIDLPIMHLELEPDEIGQDRRAARLRLYRGCTLAGFGDDGETIGTDWVSIRNLE